jgi:hypothetical protein
MPGSRDTERRDRGSGREKDCGGDTLKLKEILNSIY